MPETDRNLTYADSGTGLPEGVQAAFGTVPEPVRRVWSELRRLILETADATSSAGPLSETLKWGEPSYVTRAGTPVRLGWKAAQPETAKLLVHCQTNLVERWRERYGDTLRFEGTRAILLDVNRPLPEEVLAHCIAMALTYKRR